jgi:hypothetical protein
VRLTKEQAGSLTRPVPLDAGLFAEADDEQRVTVTTGFQTVATARYGEP